MMFPEATPYDEIAKRILGMGGGPLLLWLADYSPEQMAFVRFLPTEITLPGTAQRICDAIVHLSDLSLGGVPVAGLVEFQTVPDFDMFDRHGVAGHLLRLLHRPSELPGDRWSLAAIVVNLTGTADSSRCLEHAGSAWQIQMREKNMATCDAGVILEQLARGELPDSVSAFVSMMQKGSQVAIMQRWLEVTADMAPNRRREFAAANVVFAELTECQDDWKRLVEGLSVVESKYLNAIKAEGVKEGRVQALLQGLRHLGTVPPEVERAIRNCAEPDKLDAWLDLVFERPTMEEFRQRAGI